MSHKGNSFANPSVMLCQTRGFTTPPGAGAHVRYRYVGFEYVEETTQCMSLSVRDHSSGMYQPDLLFYHVECNGCLYSF